MVYSLNFKIITIFLPLPVLKNVWPKRNEIGMNDLI